MIEFFKQPVPASPRSALPLVTFPSSVTFHLNGDEMRVVHVPRAHTDGDAIVYFMKSDVVHMGDTYFAGMYPFIDTSSGGTIDGMIAACDLVLGTVTDKTKLIPGHGPLSNKAELAAYREMLATVGTRIRRMVADGKTVEEIGAANPLADLDAKWGKGFLKGPKFAEMVADNLVKNR
jgi:cyclase